MYITLVEHPARVECTTELAALGFVCSIVAWLVEHHWAWLLGGVLLVAVIPSTLLAVRPTTPSCWIRRLTEVRSMHVLAGLGFSSG